QYRKIDESLDLDVQRHRDEARRRVTWEYFPEVEQRLDVELDSYVSGSYVLKEVVDNGLTPVGAEEVGTDVPIANRREEYTSTAVGKLSKVVLKHAGVELDNPQPVMLTISQIDNSPQTMVWAMRFDPVKNSRFLEQVGFTKKYITHEVLVEALKRKKAISQDVYPSKQEVLGTQFINMS